MALNEDQVDHLWQRRITAETYALYFGDLANRSSRRKQAITFLSFLLSSAAAATFVGRMAPWVPVALSLSVAAMTAYSVAVSLDSRIRTMSKLHFSWSQIAGEYYRLWNRTYSDDAEEQFHSLLAREHDLSELATTDAPNNQRRLLQSQEQVFKMHRLTSA